MAMASHLEIPCIHIQSKRRAAFRSLLVKVKDVTAGGATWILTPSLSKMDMVMEYVVKDEYHNEEQNAWLYRMEPSVKGSMWDWNHKTDRLDMSLSSLGGSMGRLLDNEDVISWSIIVKWYRPK
jgi:hypothetical protein